MYCYLQHHAACTTDSDCNTPNGVCVDSTSCTCSSNFDGTNCENRKFPQL